MAYTPHYVTWEDEPDTDTPITAAALNKMESGIGAAHTEKVDRDAVEAATARLVACKLLAGDAQPAFRIYGNGTQEWGPGGSGPADVNLFRGGAGILGSGAAIRGGADVSANANPDGSWKAESVVVGHDGGALAPSILFGGDATTELHRAAQNVIATADKFDPAALNLPTKAGVPVDGDIIGGAAVGDIVFDSTSWMLWIKQVGGTWAGITIGYLDPNQLGGTRLGPVAKTITDWNSANENGWWMGATVANSPAALAGGWTIGIVTVHNAIWITQEVWCFTDAVGSTRYERRCNNGSWSAWVPMGASGPSLVTALPGSPTDGQEIILVDSLTAPTYSWHLRYISGKASNKWVFVGGSPIFAEVATQESGGPTSYSALTTAGPSIALPVAGDYAVSHGFRASCNTGVTNWFAMSYDIGGTGAVDADAAWGPNPQVASPQQHTSVSRTRKKTGLTAATLTAKYKCQNGNALYFADRWISALPIAVGG